MKIVVDTNVLVRLFAEDDEAQNRTANQALNAADTVILTLPMLCELVWVLSRGYGHSREAVAAAIRALLETRNVQADRVAVEAGIAMLDAGGDFADGVIAREGYRLGAEAFATFDRKAARLLAATGQPTQLLA